MIRRISSLLCGFAGVCATFPAASTSADQPAAARPTVVGVLEDFAARSVGPFQKGFLDSWRWSDAVRLQARNGSRLEVVNAPKGGGKLLRVRIDDPKLLADEALPLVHLSPFYPPEADALRIRLRVVSGQAVLYVGGPTAYYGNSDVFTEPQTVRAENEPQWVDVVCNFNHPTWRNYRRSAFSTDAPRNYYSRWAQEPLGIYVAAGSRGEFSIERIDLLALGEGKPFAAFAPEQVRPLKTIADFEDRRLDRTFNLYMADSETEWFEQSWKREKPLRFAPLKLAVVDGGLDGKRSLACTGRTAEEVHCTGVQTGGDAQANAFAVKIAIDAPDQRNTLVGVGATVPIDFLVFVAPSAAPFPWKRFAPAAELTAHAGPGFHYQFSYRTIQTYGEVDFAIYQTRRYLKPGDWTKLVLPAADFTCIYGHGAYRRRFVGHEPLTCDDVIAVAWLNPWCRVGRRDADVTTRIDDLTFVHVPGTSAEHRSFWQVPAVKELQYRESKSARGRIRHIALPGEKVAPAAK